MMATSMHKYSSKQNSLSSMVRESSAKLYKVIKQFNDTHRQAQKEHYLRIHTELMYQWELENENDNRYRNSARYILLAQYTYIIKSPLISKEECIWPLSTLIYRLLTDDRYLAKLITTYLINYLNTQFYNNIPSNIRQLAKYLQISERDANIRNLHRSIKKLSYLLCKVPGCRVSLSDINIMYNYLTSSELSIEELVCEQQFTRLQNYILTIRPGYNTSQTLSSGTEYDLETNQIPLDDADFNEFINDTSSDEEETLSTTNQDIPIQESIDTQLLVTSEEPDMLEVTASAHIPDTEEPDDFTVIKKCRKGNRR